MFQRVLLRLSFIVGASAVAARYHDSDAGVPQAIDVHLEEEAPGAVAGWGGALHIASSLAELDQRAAANLDAAVASQRSLQARIAGLRGAGGSALGPDAVTARGDVCCSCVAGKLERSGVLNSVPFYWLY